MKTLNPNLPPSHLEPAVGLRDYFATIALAEIIASRPHETAEKKALAAYQIADSMMRQRERATSGLQS
jgi:hypothetical protein